jgi:hypothetical protein
MSGGVTVIPSERQGIPLRNLEAIAAGWEAWPRRLRCSLGSATLRAE